MMPGCVITDLSAYELTQEERELIQHPALAGIILFTRNYDSKSQLKHLIHSILKLRQPLLIAVDQEGGRVQRFTNGFTQLPSMRYWGECYQQNAKKAVVELAEMIRTVANELKALGVNFNLVPVLDLDSGASEIIGERSFGGDPEIVTQLAQIVINTLHASGMPAVGKHFPGHGAVVADSHKELPVDDREMKQLWEKDLQPYIKLGPYLDAVMPAHVVYPALDNKPSCLSRLWLQEVLRERIDFRGVVITDDLTMSALEAVGNYSDRAWLATEAGCDLLTVCNNRAGAIEVLEAMEKRNDVASQNRIEQFFKQYM